VFSAVFTLQTPFCFALLDVVAFVIDVTIVVVLSPLFKEEAYLSKMIQ